MPKSLTRADLIEVAKANNLDPSALAAVVQVESGGSGFLPSGKLKILFEGHYMWKRLKARGINPLRLHVAKPSLAFSKWTKRYYRGMEGEWDRIAEVLAWAQKNAPDKFESYKKAAYESCSWGMFQIMGSHFESLGFSSVYEFKHYMEESEKNQLDVIIRWMNGNGLINKLRRLDWAGFARGYNGAGYAKNKYDHKLAAAYLKDKTRHG